MPELGAVGRGPPRPVVAPGLGGAGRDGQGQGEGDHGGRPGESAHGLSFVERAPAGSHRSPDASPPLPPAVVDPADLSAGERYDGPRSRRLYAQTSPPEPA